MAATKRNAMLIAEARKKIQTTQLINRLQNHALGKVEMTPTQVKAVEVLLRKSVPDLSTVALGGDHDGSPLKQVFRWAQSDSEATPDPSKKKS